MALNTYGLKMTGIKELAGMTKGIEDIAPTGFHVDIYYNTATGKVWGREQVGNSYTKYDDEDIIYCGKAKVSKTMQYIADMIYWNVREWECIKGSI